MIDPTARPINQETNQTPLPPQQELQEILIQQLAALNFCLEHAIQSNTHHLSPHEQDHLQSMSKDRNHYQKLVVSITKNLKTLKSSNDIFASSYQKFRDLKKSPLPCKGHTLSLTSRIISETEHVLNKMSTASRKRAHSLTENKETKQPQSLGTKAQKIAQAKTTKRDHKEIEGKEKDSKRALKRQKAQETVENLGFGQQMALMSAKIGRRLPARATLQSHQTRRRTPIKPGIEPAGLLSTFMKIPQKIFQFLFPPTVTAKFLYHILGDSIGATSKDLVGENQSTSWTDLADAMKEIPFIKDAELQRTIEQERELLLKGLTIQREIESASPETLEEVTQKFGKILNSLEKDQSFILPGGWSGISSHAMVYEYKKSSTPNRYQLRIHNVGAGISYHAQQIMEGKTEVSCLVIDNIKHTNIANPVFIQSLQALSQPIENWSEEHVYATLLPAIKGEIQTELAPHTDIQYSGTCSFASYFAYFQNRTGSEKCQRFRIGLGIKTLSSFISSIDRSSERDTALAEKCIFSISQMIVRAESESQISKDDLLALQIQLSQLNKVFLKKKETQTFLIGQLPPKDFTPRSPSTFLQKIPKFSPPELSSKTYPVGAILPSNTSLKETVSWAQEQVKLGNHQSVHFEIGRYTHLFHDIVTKEEIALTQLDGKEKALIIHNLSTLGRIYVDSFIQGFAQKDNYLISSNLHMFSILTTLVHCARTIGQENKLIATYPGPIANISYRLRKDFYGLFEELQNEKAFFADSTGRALSDNFHICHPKFNNNTIDITKDLPDFDSFIQHLKKYDIQAKEALPPSLFKTPPLSTNYLALFLLDSSVREKAKTILSEEFLDFRDLTDLLMFLEAARNKQIDPSATTPVQWTVRDQDEDISIKKTFSVIKSNLPARTTSLLATPPPIKELTGSHISKAHYGAFTPYNIAIESVEDEGTAPKKELLSILSNKDFQIDTAIAVFSSYPELSHHEGWRNFFEAAIFSPQLLTAVSKYSTFKNTPHIVSEYIQKQLSLAITGHDNELSIYFLRLYRKLYERTKELFSKEEQHALKKQIEKAFNTVHNTIHLSSEFTSKTRFLWHYERAHFIHCQEDLDQEQYQEQLSELLESILFCQRTVAHAPQFEYYIGSLIHKVFARKEIRKKLLQDISPIIEKSLGNPQMSRKWAEKNPLTYVSHEKPELEYHVVSGKLISQKEKRHLLETPYSLTHSTRVQQATGAQLPSSVIQESPGIFSFTINETSFLIETTKGTVEIYKKIQDSWYQYLHESQIHTSLCPHALQGLLKYDPRRFAQKISKEAKMPTALFHEHSLWISSDQEKTVFRIETHDGKCLYEGTEEIERTPEGEKSFFVIKKASSQTQILPPETLPLILQAFENREQVLVSSNQGKISEISFPRLGKLTFFFDRKKGFFRNKQYPKEILSPNQYIPSLERLRHKIVLKNESTNERKILIPGHKLSSLSIDKDPYDGMLSSDINSPGLSSLHTTASMKDQPTDKIPLYLFKEKKGKLSTENVEGKLYLAYTYLWQQKYEEAAFLLNQMGTLPLSEDALTTLSWIEQGAQHDGDARSIVIQLKAAAKRISQKTLFNKEIPNIDSSLINSYKERRHLCGNIQITREEAVLLGEDPEIFCVHISQLSEFLAFQDLPTSLPEMPYYFSEHGTVLSPHFTRNTFQETVQAFSTLDRESNSWVKLQSLFISALGIQLKEESPKERKRIQKILSIALNTPSPGQKVFLSILLAFLKHPQAFENLSIAKDFSLKKLYKTARPLIQSSSIVKREEKRKEVVCKPPYTKTLSAAPMQLDLPHIPDPGQQSLLEQYTNPLIATPNLAESNAATFTHELCSLIANRSAISQQAQKECLEAVHQFTEQMQIPCELTTSHAQLLVTISQIEKQATQTKATIKKHRVLIKSILSKRSPAPGFSSLQDLLGKAGFISDATLQEAIYALIKPFPQGFFDINPALDLEDARELQEAVQQYLVHKTSQQHLQNTLQVARKASQEIEKGKIPLQENLQKLHSLLQTKRAYNPSDNPQYLVFENIFGFFLREQQVENFNLFLSGDNKATSRVLEMIMAAGKTSVLLPILGYLAAQQGKLSVLVVPESLYPSMTPQIEQSLQKSFSTHLFSWNIRSDEQTPLTSLRIIEKGLKTALAEQNVIILQPKDFTGLFLQFLSTIDAPPNEENSAKIETFQSIFSLFSSSGAFLFDEVDSIWNVLKAHLLSTGSLQPLHPTVIEISTQLFKHIPEDAYHLQTKDFFSKTVFPKLVHGFLTELQASHISSNHLTLIENYLYKKIDKEQLSHLPQVLKDAATCTYEQIHTILPDTLQKIYGVHYGKAKQEQQDIVPVAVPYENGVPIPHSRFGHELEEINYTFQMFMQLSTTTLPLFEYIQTVHAQLRQEREIDPNMPIERCLSSQFLVSSFGKEDAIKIMVVSPETGAKLMATLLQDHPPAKIDFIRNSILSKISRPNEYSKTSSQIYSSLCSLMRGFSGTLWNKDTYPIPSISSPETIGKTLHIMASEPSDVTIYTEKSTLIKQNPGFIDIEGVFKDEKGIAVAHAILEQSDPEKIDGIIFYDDQQMPRILCRDGKTELLTECSIPQERRTAFWALPYTTGSDLKVANTTYTTSIGIHTIFRDLLQGVWRARNLGKGQHIHFAISKETAEIIRAQLAMDADTAIETKQIIAYTLEKQVERQSSDNFRALQHKTNAILESGFIQYILKKGPSQLPNALDQCRELFIQKTPPHPFDRYGNKEEVVPTKSAISSLFSKITDSQAYKFLLEKKILTPQYVSEKLELLAQMETVLPETVPLQHADTNTMIQIQTQTQTKTQTVTEVDVTPMKQKEIVNIHELWSLKPKETLQKDIVTDLHAVFSKNESTRKYIDIIPPNIATSLNLHQITNPQFSPLSSYTQPIEYALYGEQDGENIFILLNHADASSFSSSSYHKKYLINIHTGIILSSKKRKEKFPACIPRTFLKIFSGDLRLTHKEYVALYARCLQLSPNGFEKMAEFIQDYVCLLHPHANGSKEPILTFLKERGGTFMKHMETTLGSSGERTLAGLSMLFDKITTLQS